MPEVLLRFAVVLAEPVPSQKSVFHMPYGAPLPPSFTRHTPVRFSFWALTYDVAKVLVALARSRLEYLNITVMPLAMPVVKSTVTPTDWFIVMTDLSELSWLPFRLSV